MSKGRDPRKVTSRSPISRKALSPITPTLRQALVGNVRRSQARGCSFRPVKTTDDLSGHRRARRCRGCRRAVGDPCPGRSSPGSSVPLQCALPYADAKERVSPVLFVALFREKEGSSVTLDAFLARRMQGPQLGKAPTKGRIEGLTLLGEYWLQSPDPKVVVISTAESDGPMLELSAEWEENFDVTVVPASKVEDLMLS